MQQVVHTRPVYQLGKIKNIYVIFDILGYSIEDFTEICELLYSSSRQMRQMLKKNYIELRNMLYESHLSLEANVWLTYDYKTSRAAHQRLEIIMKKEFEKMKKIDYGLQLLPDTILHIANDEEFQWLLQPELKAIKDGLIYVEDKDCYRDDLYDGKYRGYLNAQGQRQGVGILIDIRSSKFIGEWHDDNLNGITKKEWSYGVIEWGQFKHGKREGYLTQKYSDGRVDYRQYENDLPNGYGI